jgi:negative regulator of replication initiation
VEQVLLKDGVRYLAHEYAEEAELEEVFAEHAREIFGSGALLFRKRRIRSRAGLGTIPDAFVIDIDHGRWFVVEVELAEHQVYQHIVTQISKFRSAIANSRGSLVSAFYDEVKEQADLEAQFMRRDITEIYKKLSDIVSAEPNVIIVIDRPSDEARQALGALQFDTEIVRLGTYYRNGTVPESHIHQFVSLEPAGVFQPPTERQKPEARQAPSEEPQAEEVSLTDDHGGRAALAYIFQGQEQRVSQWKELYVSICQDLYDLHRDEFGRVFDVKGRTREYFSRNPEELFAPRPIGSTGIYAETNMGADQLCRVVEKVMEKLNHSPDEVRIRQKER